MSNVSDTYTPPSGASKKIERRYWYTLIVLTAIYACHSLDRAVVSVVIEPMKAELELTDSDIGVVAGLGYGIAFALAAIPVGIMVDRFNRVRLLSVLVMLWSLFTAVAGFARGFLGLLLARVGVGAAEAGGQPAALSILSDSFPESRRATALGIFYLGASIGYGISYIAGGFLAAEFGWRTAFFVAGLPGISLGILLLLTVKEPLRKEDGSADADGAPGLSLVFSTMVNNRIIRNATAAMVLAAFCMTAVMVWIVPLFMREHGFSLKQAGLAAAVASALFQAIGAVSAGALSDRLARRAPKNITVVPAVALGVTFPLVVVICFSPSPVLSMILYLAFGLALSSWTAAGYTTILGQTPSRMRGAVMSVVQIGCSVLGGSLAPFAVGAMSDAVGGAHSLAWAISICAISGLWSSIHFILAGRGIRQLNEAKTE